MASEVKEEAIKPIKFGSEEHERMLTASYKLSLTEAKLLVAQRLKDHMSVPYDVYERAKGLISALSTKPTVTAFVARPMSHATG